MTVAVDHHDVAQLGQRVGEHAQPRVELHFVRENLGVRHALEQLVRVAGGEFERLEHFERVLIDLRDRVLEPVPRVVEVLPIGVSRRRRQKSQSEARSRRRAERAEATPRRA